MKKNPKKDTVGKQYLRHSTKDEAVSAIDLQRSMTEDYIENIKDTALKFRKDNPGNFFIVVITKREPLMPKALRLYFLARKSCPTPDYDQSIFRYNCSNEDIEYIWTIPCRDTCQHLKMHAHEVHDSEKLLLQFVLDFADGTLYELSKRLNGETAAPGVMLQA